ncbi:MAG: TlpA family protein disulfide reductase [Methylococcaceae bacterium]|nr:TlpA family protein disulfide reductase [Methylococcaceae bacterium]
MKKFIFLTFFLLNSGTCIAVEEGQNTPSCPALTKDADLGLYQGKVVLVDFWATWCPPCIKSMPFFNGLRNELAGSGFEILAINVDEENDAARQFLQTHPVDYKIAFDPGAECPKIFEVKAMPSSYLLDKSGKVRKIFLGYRDSDQASIKSEIKALLAE